MKEFYEPFDTDEIDENLPTLAIIMAVCLNQGSTPEAHKKTCDVLDMELRRGLAMVPDEESYEALEVALRAVVTHRRTYVANAVEINTEELFADIEDLLRKESEDED